MKCLDTFFFLLFSQEFVDSLGLKAGMKVLDIGSGTGGSAFYMARHHGVHVLGLDLSDNMLAIANDHKAEMDPDVRDLVEFRHQDALEADLAEGSFDVVYSRDAIMHIADKPRLYQNVHVSQTKSAGRVYCLLVSLPG